MNNFLVIGSVQSTKVIIECLVKHNFTIVGILGYEPKNVENVSGWVDLKFTANQYSIKYKSFENINHLENLKWASDLKPELIFAVGFSQLLNEDWFNLTQLGCIGFHPTMLPKGRGRAPISWLILDQVCGSATFFLMGKGADDGPIFVQEPFDVDSEDDASVVYSKMEVAINRALDVWLPNLKLNIWCPVPQEEAEASWYAKRSISDGNINWGDTSVNIDRLIKATSYPHPGAYTYYKDKKLIIWKSKLESSLPIKGVVGRVLLNDIDKGSLIQCGVGLIWIYNIEVNGAKVDLKIGDKLGYNIEDEIFKLKTQSNEF